MSVQYAAVSWNRQKKIYDATLVLLFVLYICLFVGLGAWRNPNATAETLLIRAFGHSRIPAVNRCTVHWPAGETGSALSSSAV